MRTERILAIILLLELAIFAAIAPNFATVANTFEITRLAVELGLLALALTPIIIAGGIDLSVGSMMGLAAVIFGALWRDAHLPIFTAALMALATGMLGGSINAVLITRLRTPPLIVTLGTYSLFRGMAHGLTSGITSYSGFPATFLYLGQGYLFGFLPPQLLLFAAGAVAWFLLLHRTVYGRTFHAIGFSPEGARYAGIPVARRLGLLYVLAGMSASAAAIIYVAHLGQAKSDAGTGYELMAITAVVLGGTSIFGGRGTIPGTLLGLFAISVLQNGLRLAALPGELSGILTGGLLIATMSIDRYYATRSRATPATGSEETTVKNSQVAVLSAVIVASALLICGSNWYLARSLRGGQTLAASVTSPHAPVIGMMPKAKGDPYFVSCRLGAEEAAREHGDELIWDGPTDLDAAKQNEVVEGWISRGVDVIAVSVENRAAISTVLRKARARGIRVITWDADAEPEARDFFINQATPQGIGETLTDEAARLLGGRGDFAIVTASLSAANQNEWIGFIKQRLAQKYPELHLVAIRPSDGDRDRAFQETQTLLKVYPQVKLVMGVAAPAVPGIAEAVRQSERTDVKVIGLSLPNLCKPYVHSGVVQSVVLWNTRDLGYLAVTVADSLSRGTLKAGAASMEAGRLGRIQIEGTQVRLGAPFIFNKANIDQFDW